MNCERLLKLADFLEREVPDTKYRQFTFFEAPRFAMWGGGFLAGLSTKFWSGACALGWATQIPDFKEAGLRMNFWKYGRRAAPVYGSLYQPYEAGMKFFGLNYDESHYLFGCGFDSKREKIEQIREMVQAYLIRQHRPVLKKVLKQELEAA